MNTALSTMRILLKMICQLMKRKPCFNASGLLKTIQHLTKTEKGKREAEQSKA